MIPTGWRKKGGKEGTIGTRDGAGGKGKNEAEEEEEREKEAKVKRAEKTHER